jgi:hypothetical protein
MVDLQCRVTFRRDATLSLVRVLNSVPLSWLQKLTYNSTDGALAPDHAEPREEAPKRREILSIFDYAERLAREFQIEATEAEPETFAWIWEDGPGSPGFSDWLAQETGLFWIFGKPASGKSTLMDYLTKDCNTLERLKIARTSDWIIVRFFFDFRAGQGISNNFEGLLKSLLLQLLKEVDDLRSLLPDFCYGKEHASTMSITQTRKLLEALLRQIPSNLCIFIDGLDEFQGDMHRLTRFLKTIPRLGNCLVKLCVASRPGPYISTAFTHFPNFQLEKYNSSGIKRFVSLVLEDVPVASKQDQEKLIEEITKRAHGVFLWARFAVYELVTSFEKGEDVTKLSARLASLPPELKDIYTRILDNLNADERSEASMMFRLVGFAIGILSPEILSVAMDCALGETHLQKGPLRPETSERIRRRIRSLTGGLIEVVGPVNKYEDTPDVTNFCPIYDVKLIHKTAQSYLECNDWLSTSRLDVPSPWLQICSKYLSVMSQELQALESRPKQQAMVRDLYADDFLPKCERFRDPRYNSENNRNLFNFSRYSAAKMFQNALMCERDFGISSYDLMRQCITPGIVRLHRRWDRCYLCNMFHPSNENSPDLTLYYITCHGLALSLDQAIAGGADVNVPGYDTLKMALHFARSNQHGGNHHHWSLKLVHMLLDSNVHVNDENILFAMSYNTVGILELLLAHRPAGKLRLRTIGDNEVGPLWAWQGAIFHLEEKIDLLLRRGEDVNDICGPEGTALQAAILSHTLHSRVPKVVKCLLDRGADPNINCVSGVPLATAWIYVPKYLRHSYSYYWLPYLVRLLLDHGAHFGAPNVAVAMPSKEEMWDLCKLSKEAYIAKYKIKESDTDS